MRPLRITAHSVASACGAGVPALSAALREGRSGLRANDFTEATLAAFIGRVPGVEDCGLVGLAATVAVTVLVTRIARRALERRI